MEEEILEPVQKTIIVDKPKEEEPQSESNIEEDLELEEMGSCFGEFSNKAKECKVCKINETCSQETKGEKK